MQTVIKQNQNSLCLSVGFIFVIPIWERAQVNTFNAMFITPLIYYIAHLNTRLERSLRDLSYGSI